MIIDVNKKSFDPQPFNRRFLNNGQVCCIQASLLFRAHLYSVLISKSIYQKVLSNLNVFQKNILGWQNMQPNPTDLFVFLTHHFVIDLSLVKMLTSCFVKQRMLYICQTSYNYLHFQSHYIYRGDPNTRRFARFKECVWLSNELY